MELTISVARVEQVNALGSLVIALPRFRPDGIAAQGNHVLLDYPSLAQQFERPLFLEDYHTVGVRRGHGWRLRLAESAEQPDQCASEHSDAHVRDYIRANSARC